MEDLTHIAPRALLALVWVVAFVGRVCRPFLIKTLLAFLSGQNSLLAPIVMGKRKRDSSYVRLPSLPRHSSCRQTVEQGCAGKGSAVPPWS